MIRSLTLFWILRWDSVDLKHTEEAAAHFQLFWDTHYERFIGGLNIKLKGNSSIIKVCPSFCFFFWSASSLNTVGSSELRVHFLKSFGVSKADISKVTSDIDDTEIYGTYVGLILVFHQRTRCLEQAQVLIAEVHLRHDHTIHDHPRTTQRPPAFRWFKIWSSPVSCLTSPISYLYLHCFVPAWCGPFVFLISPLSCSPPDAVLSFL